MMIKAAAKPVILSKVLNLCGAALLQSGEPLGRSFEGKFKIHDLDAGPWLVGILLSYSTTFFLRIL
jgi:hypothetical protein